MSSAKELMFLCFQLLQQHTYPLDKNHFLVCVFSPLQELFYFLVCFKNSKKMNIHFNLNQMGNMIYEDPTRIVEEEEDIVQGVSRTFSEEEESSSCSFSSMCSSSDLTDDDDDDVSSSSSNRPLEDLSDLMAHLPIKRGLSKFYEGRSQSFTSLANVKSLEDLMKRRFQKNRNYGARRKPSRSSTGGILDQSYKRVYSSKPTISKKLNKTPSSTLSSLARKRH